MKPNPRNMEIMKRIIGYCDCLYRECAHKKGDSQQIESLACGNFHR
jgi:hypothetical protein